MRKSTKISTILLLLILPVSIGLLVGFTLASNTESIDLIPIDIGPELRTKDLPVKGSFSQSDATSKLRTSQTDYYEEGTLLDWLILDFYLGVYEFSEFQLRNISDDTELWVQVDMSYPDGRAVPVITEEQADYMLTEFENDIAPICNSYFGNPDFHDGSNGEIYTEYPEVPEGTYDDENGRLVILVSNIRDEAYYLRSYPYYTVGFYSPTFERLFDRNIISIDSADWENRVGDDAARPNLYEATVAHEYQHLIHDDYNPEDDLFMNEGCSMYAEPLCGYPIDWSSINSFLATPDNSLTEWADQGDINILADYGQGLLWSIYLSDHYGGADFLSYFVQTGIPGIEGINNALSHFGSTKTFEEVFNDWKLANLLHTNDIGGGLFNYIWIDLGSEDADPIRVYDIKRPWIPPTTGTDFGQTKTILHKNTDIYLVSSYGTDYFMLSGLSDSMSLEFIFNGDDYASPPMWTRVDQDGDGDLEWYSTSAGSEKDIAMITLINVPSAPAFLSFETYYDIEILWDYGFVQVSTDGGESWESLENSFTTTDHDPDAYPAIIENLPGLTGEFGWANMSFDISAYAGQSVLLGFRYMTDWATENPGWWVDDIRINDQLIDNADDRVVFTTPPPPETDFIVHIVDVTVTNEIPSYIDVFELPIDNINEYGSLDLSGYIHEEGYLIVLVTPKIGPADYTYEITR